MDCSEATLIGSIRLPNPGIEPSILTDRAGLGAGRRGEDDDDESAVDPLVGIDCAGNADGGDESDEVDDDIGAGDTNDDDRDDESGNDDEDVSDDDDDESAVEPLIGIGCGMYHILGSGTAVNPDGDPSCF